MPEGGKDRPAPERSMPLKYAGACHPAVPPGPSRRCRSSVPGCSGPRRRAADDRGALKSQGPRDTCWHCWNQSGFSVYHGERIDPDDHQARQRLAGYMVHPPIAKTP